MKKAITLKSDALNSDNMNHQAETIRAFQACTSRASNQIQVWAYLFGLGPGANKISPCVYNRL